MPIPILVVYIGAAVIAAVAGGAAYKWRQVVAFFFGKPIAILGMRSTGKTTLRNFLERGEIDGVYKETRVSEGRGGGASSVVGGLKAKAGDDLGGDVSLRGQWHATWKIAADGHGFVLYLVEAPKVLNDNQEQLDRIMQDASVLARWLAERRSAGGGTVPRFVVLGTHADKLDGWSTASGRTKSQDDFAVLPALEELRQLEGCCGVVIGSLAAKEDSIDFLDNVVQALKGTPRGSP